MFLHIDGRSFSVRESWGSLILAAASGLIIALLVAATPFEYRIGRDNSLLMI